MALFPTDMRPDRGITNPRECFRPTFPVVTLYVVYHLIELLWPKKFEEQNLAAGPVTGESKPLGRTLDPPVRSVRGHDPPLVWNGLSVR